MKFDVSFGGFLSMYQPLYGRGTAHLLETGLLIEGHRCTAMITGYLGLFYPLYTALSVLTIPYSTIVTYRPPFLLLRSHTLHIVTPKQGRVPIFFRVRNGSAEFTARLVEYRTAASAFGQVVDSV